MHRSWVFAAALTIVLAGLFAVAAVAQSDMGQSQQNGLIALTRQDKHQRDQIVVMHADGTGQRALTTPAANDAEPAWSPDGRKLAFVTNTGDLAVMNADGSGRRILARDGPATDWYPKWSPDGTRIVFERTPAHVGVPGLYVINADGTDKRRLSPPGYHPAWSPDGKRIVFVDLLQRLDVIDLKGRLRVILDTGALFAPHGHQVMSTCTLEAPAWSPDGKRIMFERGGCGGQHSSQIMVVPTDGKTDDYPLTRRTPNIWDSEPTWSPDGKQIAFSRGPRLGELGDLYLMNADGSHLRRVTNTNRDFGPSWQASPR
jgi:Tol biopolymer transport system component